MSFNNTDQIKIYSSDEEKTGNGRSSIIIMFGTGATWSQGTSSLPIPTFTGTVHGAEPPLLRDVKGTPLVIALLLRPSLTCVVWCAPLHSLVGNISVWGGLLMKTKSENIAI